MDMKCPVCRSPLEDGGMEPLETLSEHVSNPNGPISHKMSFRCSGASCPTRGAEVIWNSDGERYGGFSFDKKNFIKGNDAPFGSIFRRINVECHNSGLPERKELFTIGGIRFLMESDYRADEDGNVIRRKWRLTKLKRDRKHWISYEWPIVDFFRSVKQGVKSGFSLRKKGRKPRSGFETIHFRVIKWEDRWWRIWAVKVNRFLFPSLVKELPFREK